MTSVTRDLAIELAILSLVYRASHNFTLANGATMFFGIDVPATARVLVMSRDYFSASTSAEITLYESEFADGDFMPTINRDLELRNLTKPVGILYGVTPAGLTDIIAQRSITEPNGVRVGVRGDDSPYVLKAGASYVLGIKNTGSTSQPFSFAVDYRLLQPWEARA